MGNDPRQLRLQLKGEPAEGLEPAPDGPSIPLVPEAAGCPGIMEVPEVLQAVSPTGSKI